MRLVTRISRRNDITRNGEYEGGSATKLLKRRRAQMGRWEAAAARGAAAPQPRTWADNQGHSGGKCRARSGRSQISAGEVPCEWPLC